MSVVAAAFLTEDTAATIKQAPAGVAGRAFSPLPAILLVYSVPGSAVPAAPRPEAVRPSAQIGIPAPEHACRYARPAGRALSPFSWPFHHFPCRISGQKP
jgi:hypothetical protein